MIGIIGSGLMGKSIAIEFAKSGREVLVFSAQRHLSDENLKLEIQSILSRSKIENTDSILQYIKIAHNESDFSDCDLIIEALKENLELKRDILSRFSQYLKKDTPFCSNTSSLSLEEIFKGIYDLKKVLGLHFFNPPSIMKLVEISILETTDNDTIQSIRNLIHEIGKEPVIVHNSPGFIVNKLLIPYINEATKLLESGIASMEDIDKAMVLGANHPIGPFKLADLIGIDVIYAILNTFIDKGQKINIAQTIIDKVNENKLGRKTKIGFYDYSIK